jgi:hypothetical protein
MYVRELKVSLGVARLEICSIKLCIPLSIKNTFKFSLAWVNAVLGCSCY